MPSIFENWNFRVREVRDFPDDPAPRVTVEFKAAQLGGGNCQCGRQTPKLALSGDLEEEELVSLCRSIIRYYATRKARQTARGTEAARLAERIQNHSRRELEFLARWEAELRGTDPFSQD